MSPERSNKKSIVPQANNVPYLIAVVSMAVVAITGSILITVFRPDSDIVVVFGLVAGFMTPTTISLLSFMKAQETHLSVNSRLDEFIYNAKLSSRAEGVEEGRKIANDRTDKLKENDCK
jgi:hypothetical protein